MHKMYIYMMKGFDPHQMLTTVYIYIYIYSVGGNALQVMRVT